MKANLAVILYNSVLHKVELVVVSKDDGKKHIFELSPTNLSGLLAGIGSVVGHIVEAGNPESNNAERESDRD